jgi:TRAP transporter TAXI family solute receptor
MKKNIYFQFFLAMVVLSLISAPVAGAEVHKYIIGTGPTGGVFYPLGAAIAKVVSQYAEGIEISVQSTGASTENTRLLGTKKIELGIAGGGIVAYGYHGKEMFDKAYPNIRGIGFIYPDVDQWVVMADSAIYSLQDMKGKRVGVGAIGSGTESTSKIMFDIIGMSYSDFTPIMLPMGQYVDRFRDRQLDAAHFQMNVPYAGIIDLEVTHKIRILELKGDYRKRLQEKHPFYISITIPAGTYKSIDKDIETTGLASSLFTREDIPADDVYKITKALYEHSDEIAKIHPAGKSIQLKDAPQGIFIPFHEGALRYYKEKGIKIKQ